MLWSLKLYCSRDYHKVTPTCAYALTCSGVMVESDSTVDEERLHKISSQNVVSTKILTGP